jgi:hypothetical protein
LILDEIDTLILDWFPSKPEIQIACVGCFSRNETKASYFSIDQCEKAIVDGISEISCSNPLCINKIR